MDVYDGFVIICCSIIPIWITNDHSNSFECSTALNVDYLSAFFFLDDVENTLYLKKKNEVVCAPCNLSMTVGLVIVCFLSLYYLKSFSES